MALDACSGHATEKMTLLDRPGRRPTVPISPISPGLAQDLIPQQRSQIITPAPPSPSPPSDASNSHVEDTIVCAFAGSDLRQQSHARRRVTFDEVFQDGNAAVKHFIIQIPSPDGPWYILHCDEHQQAFQHPALRGAAAHLKGRKHGLPWYPTSLEVVKHFGVEVVDCDAELAEKNNSVALAVSQVSKRPFECKKGEKLSPKKRPHESNEAEVKGKQVPRRHLKQRRLSGITRPIPGRIYLAYWETTKDWLPALVLPHIGLEAFGIPSTLEKLGLMSQPPACLRCEPDTQNLKWREGYEHDGPRAMEREFPVLFFDRRDFPGEASAGWVKAGDLQELKVFHTSSRLVPNLKFAKKYLRKRLQQEADCVDESSSTSSRDEGSGSDTPLIRATDNESPPKPTFSPTPLEPDQPETGVLKDNPQIEEAPLPQNSESEVSVLVSMPLSPIQSRPGTSKSQVEDTPINPSTGSIPDDITIISISSSEDEADEDQPATVTQLPTPENRIVAKPGHLVVTKEKDAASSITPKHNFPLRPITTPSIPTPTGHTMQYSVAPLPPRNEHVSPRVQLPTPIHVHHIPNILPNHSTLNLRNLMTRSTYTAFPGALPGSEAPQSELPPIQPPTNRQPLKFPIPQDPPASGFHHHQLPQSLNPPVTPSQPQTSHVSPTGTTISSQTRPLAPRPSQPATLRSSAPSAPLPPPPPPDNRAHAGKTLTPPAPKPNPPQEPSPARNTPPTSSPISWRPVHVGKAVQLDTANPRFGVPPNEVPPPFLDRLKKLAGTRDNFPRMAKFFGGDGLYVCPWCEKRYRRPVKFTDHLVLNHSR